MGQIRYRIEYDTAIEDKLRQIPKNIRVRIKEAIEKRLTIAHLDYGKPLQRELKGFRRLRVGDYRIVYKVYEDRIVVHIIDIDYKEKENAE